jgi:parallel beta-helix repeat protein
MRTKILSGRVLVSAALVTATLLSREIHHPSAAYAATYFVATTGSDSNPGTSSHPFQTIAKGLSALSAGGTLYLKAGTYVERIDSHSVRIPSGTSWVDAPVIAANPGDTVILQPGVGNEVLNLADPYVQYVIFDGLIIDATGHKFGISINKGAHHIRIKNCEVKNAIHSGILSGYGSGVAAPNSQYLEFLNCKVHHNGTVANLDHGFYLGGSNNLIEGCEVYSNAAWGVHLYTGDTSKPVRDNIVRRNYIHDNNAAGRGRGGVIVSSGPNNRVYNNLVVSNTSGIQISYANATDNLVYNNTIYGHSAVGITIHSSASDTQVKNNILYQNNTAISDGGRNTTQANNLTSDPSFVNASGGDFRLQGGSAAIDRGETLGDVSDDYAGSKRPAGAAYDIGAYEYSGTALRPPSSPANLQVQIP